MNRITPILISLLFCSLMGHGQSFEPIDSIDWSIAGDGARSGVTPGFGYTWTAATPAADPDGAGIFAVQGGTFRIEDAEGTEGCDCDFEVSTNCGKNDNTIFIPAAVVMGYCKIRVSMTVTTSGNLDCGGTSDQLIPGTCPSDIDATWAGTDAMSIKVSGSALVDTDGHDICGEQGIGFVELTVDVSPVDAISLFITGGTQNSDEFYAISNIVIEGVRRDINDLNLTLTTQPRINNSNIICENNGTPLKFQVAASANNATFQWTGPNAWISSDASPEILNYDPTWSGTYRVTVTDRFSCPIMDEIDVTILAWDDANCRPQALFSNLFPTQCSDFTLPSMDDVGVPGTWAPSNDLSFFADSTLTFTFTPSEPAIGEYSQEMKVFDISESNRPAIQPTDRDRTIFCTAASDQVDLIELFNMNLDYTITVTGDKALFDKITTGQSINSVEQEYRTFSFLGVDPGPYEFFVEAVANCQTAEPILIPLSITVVDQNPVILNASLCSGDYIDTLGFRIFGDTIIMTGGACDTVVRATISKLLHGVRPASSPHPTGSQISNCGNVFYFYGDEFQGSSQGVFVSATRDEAPPRGPDFDTIFYTSYTGPFTLPYPASNGCDSIVNIALNLGDPTFTFDSIPLCSGMDTMVTYRGADYLITEANPVIFPPRVIRPDGSCDVHEIRGIYAITQRDTIRGMFCASQDTMIEGQLFNINNPTDIVSIPAINGAQCPSLLFVDLTFDEPERGTLDTFICAGNMITVGGIEFTETVTAMDILLPIPASDGCDSILTLTLTIQDPVFEPITPTVCLDSTFTFLGKAYDTNNSSGMDTIRSAQGCDSIIYDINVSFFSDPLLIINPDTSFCANSSVFYPEYNVTLDANRLQYDTVIITPNGCTQTVMFSGTLIPVQDTMIEVTICAGESYILGSQTLTSTTIATEIFTANTTGCDSTVRLTLTVNPVERTALNESFSCPGGTVAVGPNVYSSSGIYVDTLQSITGCDSIITLDLVVPDSIITPIDTFICAGSELVLNADRLTTAGIYDVIYFAANGCDSIVRVNLEVIQPEVTDVDIVLCPGETILVFNNSFGNSSDREITETEFFTLVGTSSRGCDSTINLTLTQVSVGPPTLIEAICFGENVQVGNSIYTESGFYADTLSSSFGCDSIVRLDLDVRPQYINDLALTICTDGSITVGDSVITEVGFYAITISSVDGCDSLLNVTLSIGDAFITPLNVRICSGDEFIVGNSTYNSSGSYSDTIQSFAGCDSIINLELFVLEVQRTQLDTTICAGETLELDGNMFSTSIMDSVTILSSEGCDSIIIDFNLTVLNEINTVTNHNICPGESIRVGTSTYDMAGTYMDTIIASTGCDSIIRSIVSARDSIIVTLNQQICNGGSFTVGSSNYSAAGDYQDILLSNTGCDSIVMLSLEVVDQIETNIVVTICIGESYGFDGQDLTASGQYLDTLSSNLGCDSIVTLDLTVAPELAIIIENIIGSCEGVANGAFIIRDISGATPPFAVSGLPDISTIDMLPFTVTGLNPQTYSIDIADANGCTATIDVVITEDRNSAVTINATTIDPTGLYELSLEVNGTIGSIAWDNIPGLSCYECIDPMADILERTTFRVVVTDVDGCISMAEITLDVNGIGNIYVPNIFNPESRIGNHRFFIQGEDDSEAIYDLQIYDRWGSLIFGTIGATLSDPDFGWDGTMGGRRLNADVYIYSGRVYDVNGSVQLINGDLTMLK